MDHSAQQLLDQVGRISDLRDELRTSFIMAVELTGSDPEMAVTRARKTLSLMVEDVYRRKAKEPGTTPLETLLSDGKKRGIIPERIVAYAQTVKDLGNIGAHSQSEKLDSRDVMHSLAALLPILQWYASLDRPLSLDTALPQAPPQSSSLEREEIEVRNQTQAPLLTQSVAMTPSRGGDEATAASSLGTKELHPPATQPSPETVGRRGSSDRRPSWVLTVGALLGSQSCKFQLAKAQLEVMRYGSSTDADHIASLARAYRRAIQAGLKSRPAEAQRICDEYDRLIPSPHYRHAFTSKDAAWLAWAFREDHLHAMRICLTLAARLDLPGPLLQAARRLARLLVESGDSKALIDHLSESRKLGVRSQEFLEEGIRGHLSKGRSLDETWRPLLENLTSDDVPPLFEVAMFLGRVREAAHLACSVPQRRDALAACLKSRGYDDVVAGLPLADALGDAEARQRLHERLGHIRTEDGDHALALDHYLKANSALNVSLSHERLGDDMAALRTCPRTAQDRIVSLARRCENSLFDVSGRHEYLESLVKLQRIRGVLGEVADPSPEICDLAASLTRHGDALLTAARRHFSEQAEGRTTGETRAVFLRWSHFEDVAGDKSRAAQLAERGGDFVRASRLWEADEKFGPALLALGREAPRVEIIALMAELCERGGDLAKAGNLFEQAGRPADASRVYQSAGQHADAARCLRTHLGDEAAAESGDYANLMGKADLTEELVSLCLRVVKSREGHNPVAERLRRLLLPDPTIRIGASLRAEVENELRRLRQADREIFLLHVKKWLPQAREEVLGRFSNSWGMDLGTSKCVVAVYDLNRREALVCPFRGQSQFPSILAFDAEGHEVVGLGSEDLLMPHIRASIATSKRRMGTSTTYKMGGRVYKPEDVAARLVAYGRMIVEEFLRDQVRLLIQEIANSKLKDVPAEWVEEVTGPEQLAISMPKAVITVPAYFGFNQKRATRDAAEIAGVKVMCLINEPTAAIIAACEGRRKQGRFIVVDLGAGTLDLSHVDIADGVYEVCEVFGDNEFGSSDFDSIIADHLLASLRSKQGIEVTPKGLSERRVRVAAENLKIQLSSQATATSVLHAFGDHGDVVFELTRAELESVLKPLLQKLDKTCKLALATKPESLLLVGGPMLSPLIRSHLESLFGLKAMQLNDPRTAVACGAALQAAVLMGDIKDLLLLDVVPFSMGIKVVDNNDAKRSRVNFLIEKNTTIPTHKEETFTTAEDNQPAVTIVVLQGESPNPEENIKLGQFDLVDIPPAPSGKPQIKVSFEIDSSSILTVTARNLETLKETSIKITDTTMLTPAERSAMKGRFDTIKRLEGRRKELDSLVQRMRDLIDRAASLDCRGMAAEWRRRFDAYERSMSNYVLQESDQRPLFDMFNHAAEAENLVTLTADRVENQKKTCGEFAEMALKLNATAENYGESLNGLLDPGRTLEQSLRQLLDERSQLYSRFADWNAALAGLGLKAADARQHFVSRHETGDHRHAVLAFRELPTETDDPSLIWRYLDSLAHTRDREGYRKVLAEHGLGLGTRTVDFHRLNDFCKSVLPALAWIRVDAGEGARAEGSGFLVASNLVATNRHVLSMGADERKIAPCPQIRIHVDGCWRSAEEVILPQLAELDLALVRLIEPTAATPFRLGYSELVELGERVLGLGFPLAVGDSFQDNILVDVGIINRFRTWPGTNYRHFEVGIRAAPGMSGGPLFNEAGEVIGIITSVTRWALTGHSANAAPYVGQSSNALAADPLRGLLSSLGDHYDRSPHDK